MPRPKNPEKTRTTSVRMTVKLADRLHNIAVIENRSFSGQIVYFLTEAVKQYLDKETI